MVPYPRLRIPSDCLFELLCIPPGKLEVAFRVIHQIVVREELKAYAVPPVGPMMGKPQDNVGTEPECKARRAGMKASIEIEEWNGRIVPAGRLIGKHGDRLPPGELLYGAESAPIAGHRRPVSEAFAKVRQEPVIGLGTNRNQERSTCVDGRAESKELPVAEVSAQKQGTVPIRCRTAKEFPVLDYQKGLHPLPGCVSENRELQVNPQEIQERSPLNHTVFGGSLRECSLKVIQSNPVTVPERAQKRKEQARNRGNGSPRDDPSVNIERKPP